jgi:hypothetical protein
MIFFKERESDGAYSLLSVQLTPSYYLGHKEGQARTFVKIYFSTDAVYDAFHYFGHTIPFNDKNDEVLHDVGDNNSWLVLKIKHESGNSYDSNAIQVYYQDYFIGYVQKVSKSIDNKIAIERFCFDNYGELKNGVFIVWDGKEFLLASECKNNLEIDSFDMPMSLIRADNLKKNIEFRSKYRSTTAIANSHKIDRHDLFKALIQQGYVKPPSYPHNKKSFILTDKGIDIGGMYRFKTLDDYTLDYTEEFDNTKEMWIVWPENLSGLVYCAWLMHEHGVK